MKYLEKHSKMTAFLFGGLSVLAFAPHYIFVVSFLSWSVLMFLLLSAKNTKQAFVIGYCFGFAHFAFGLIWIGNAVLIEADKFAWLYPLIFIGAGSFFGLFFAIPSWLSFKASSLWQKWMVFGAFIIVFEWIRSFFLTGFPWNLLGYTVAFNDYLIQAASIGGTYLLSLFAVLSYTVLGVFLYRGTLKSFLQGLIVIFVIFSIFYIGGYIRLISANVELYDVLIRIVQPSIPQQMKWDDNVRENNFKTYLDISSSKSMRQPNAIIWGETASPFVLDRDFEHIQQVASILPKGGYLITGMISYHPINGRYRPHNSMVVINDKGLVEDYYHKSHLVPFGEYIPFREYLPEYFRPVVNVIGEFGKGKGPKIISVDGLPSFSGVICYETIFPGKIVDRDNRPNFIINITNDGWYGDSSGPYQHWVAAKLRAVEEGITVVRAANNGLSGVISAYGQEKKKMNLNDKGYIDVFLPKSLKNTTLYSLFGNGVSLTFCLILLFLGFIRKSSGRNSL